jgi:multidrug resistance efflux pump
MRKVLLVIVCGVMLWLVGGAALKFLALPMAEPDGAVAATASAERAAAPGRPLVCSGRVEAVSGEVDVSAQIGGAIAELRVTEGSLVRMGDVLAVLEGARENAELTVAEANVRLARSKLDQLRAGPGKEEIAQSLFDVHSADAQLASENSSLNRSRLLAESNAEAPEAYQQRQQRVRQLQSQRESLQKRHEALRRGALPQEVEVAKSELTLAEARLERAKVESGYRVIKAPMTGTVVEVFRHVGDSVWTVTPSPILRLADPGKVRVRLEVDEANVPRLQAGAEGSFTIQGVHGEAGRVVIKTVIPMFGPKRLFNPDTSARMDTRTLAVLCEARDCGVPLYHGQRVTARFTPPGEEVLSRRDKVAPPE